MGLPILLIYLLGEWFKFNYQLPSNQRFLIEFSILLGDAVLLHAIALWYLSHKVWKKRGPFNLFQSLFNSVSTLPKVLLSYMGLMLFTQMSLDIFQSSPLPVFFILIFFIWAPYICSFEFFARTLSEQEIEEEDAMYESMDETTYQEIPRRIITRKTWWHLGYLRSIELTSSRGTLALSVIFLLWLLRIIPELFVGLSSQPHESYLAHAVQITLTWLAGIFVHLSIVKTIYSTLPVEQRAEFDADEKLEGPKDIFANPIGIRLSILSILVLFTTMLWSEKRFQSEVFPEYAVRKLESVKFSDEEMILEMKITDADQALRWFHPSRFRLLELSAEDAKKREEELKQAEEKRTAKKEKTEKVTKDEKTAEKDDSAKDLDQKETQKGEEKSSRKADPFAALVRMINEKVEQPNRYVVYDDKRVRLEDYQIAPRKEEVSVVVAFPIRKHADNTAQPLFEVSYVNPFGYKEVLFTFKKKAFE